MKRTPLARKVPLRRHGNFYPRAFKPALRTAPLRTSARTRRRKTSERLLKELCRRLVVELRDGNRCQYDGCGNTADNAKIDWAHIKNRGAKSIVYAPWNSLALCVGHHRWLDGNKGNLMHPGAGLLWWLAKYPERAIVLRHWEHDRRKQPINREVERLFLEQEIAVRTSRAPSTGAAPASA